MYARYKRDDTPPEGFGRVEQSPVVCVMTEWVLRNEVDPNKNDAGEADEGFR